MDYYILSWSGGKDSAMALYRARTAGLKISHLINMADKAGSGMSHRLPLPLLRRQAAAQGLTLREGTADWNSYESRFLKLLEQARYEGARGCVFGDIDITEHLDWCRRICERAGMEAIHPLWGIPQEQLMEEFIELGFSALVAVVQLDRLGQDWIGRRLDKKALLDMKSAGITVAGELGEYHTLVTGGPTFKDDTFQKEIESLDYRVSTEGNYAFWHPAIQPD